MSMTRLVIPLDGSPQSAAVADRVGTIVAADEVILLYVRHGDHHDRLESLDVVQQKLEQRGHTVSRRETEATDAAAGIVDFVDSTRPDLILMAAHGWSDARRWLRGSVAERVLRACPVPLLMLSPESTVDAPFRSVLLPTDTSEASTRVLEPLIPLARSSGAGITLLFVDWDDPTDTPEQRSRRRKQRAEDVDEWLRGPRKRIEEAGLEAHVRVEHGNVAETILEVASSAKYDLLAMTTHGRTGPSRWVFGSVAEKVLSDCRLPILLHRLSRAKRDAPRKRSPS